jgi:hypothetical protein
MLEMHNAKQYPSKKSREAVTLEFGKQLPTITQKSFDFCSEEADSNGVDRLGKHLESIEGGKSGGASKPHRSKYR